MRGAEMNEKVEQMKEKVRVLNEASKAYYQEDRELIPNLAYDKLYDELVSLERETGIILSNSPTIHVGYEAVGSLPKEAHEKAMLSLDKTKDRDALREWLSDQVGILSWKLDGLTIVLTYRDGKLEKAITRGNGEIGEVITNNAKVFANLPLFISHKGLLVLRGEAVIRYSDFLRINQELPEAEAKYKNPRNLCSGSVRQLNNQITAARSVHFYAFSLVSAENIVAQPDQPDQPGQFLATENSRIGQLEWLRSQGFDVVEYCRVMASGLDVEINRFEETISKYDIPSDGLVLTFDDISYGNSLGATSKFPRDSIAFKWKDEIRETSLLEMEWSVSRTGLINPVAIFEPVELEGTIVQRASVHNISIMEALALGIGDTITVYKANMIIPQIADNLTRSGNVKIPELCPVCGIKTDIKQDNDVRSLICTNDDCIAKHIKSFTHFVGRNAMNVQGLSEETLEKLISKGLIKEPADIFRLERFRQEIVGIDGLGEKSIQKLLDSIDLARKTTAARLLYSLGIPGIGSANAKVISKHYQYDWTKIQQASTEELTSIGGIGDVMANAFTSYFLEDKNRDAISHLLNEVEMESVTEKETEQLFDQLNFVITGAVEQYENREALKGVIEEKGGKVTDSVTSKTGYLINNDALSGSSKNKKAKELGVPIITEQQLIRWMDSGIKP